MPACFLSSFCKKKCCELCALLFPCFISTMVIVAFILLFFPVCLRALKVCGFVWCFYITSCRGKAVETIRVLINYNSQSTAISSFPKKKAKICHVEFEFPTYTVIHICGLHELTHSFRKPTPPKLGGCLNPNIVRILDQPFD